MNFSDDKQRSIGQVVVSLSLDAADSLYGRLGVPAAPTTAHSIFRDIVSGSGFSEFFQDVFAAFAARWTAASGDAEKAVLGWTARTFSGTHSADPGISSWLIVVSGFQHGQWTHETMSEEERRQAQAFIRHAIETIDRFGFTEIVEDVKARYVLTDWDRRLHILYGFNFFDTSAGADPFLVLRYVDQAERLRQAVRDYDFGPGFPHDKLRTAAQIHLEKLGVWMPPGFVVPHLRDLLT